MYATSTPAPSPRPESIEAAADFTRQRLTYVVARLLRPETPTVEKANLYGQRESMEYILDWLEGILRMELPTWEQSIHLRTLATFVKAMHEGERKEASRQERSQLNSLEWHNLTTGKLQGYQHWLNILQTLGISPIR